MSEILEKIIEKIEKINTIHRILICAGIIILLSGSFIYLMIMPKFDELSALSQEQEDLDSELTSVKEKTRDLKKYKNLAKNAEEKFEKARRILPDK